MTEKQDTKSQQSDTCEPLRFSMRPIEVSDADDVAHWFQQIEDVSIFDRQLPLPVNHADVVEFFKILLADQKKKKCRWFVTETLEGATVGMTGLEQINMLHGNAILPMFVAEPFRRTGVGIRMASLMIDLAFKQLRLHRVATIYRADNDASAILLERLGFRNEGISRQSWFSHGQHFDLVNAAILHEEWDLARSPLRRELNASVTVTLGPNPDTSWRWPGAD